MAWICGVEEAGRGPVIGPMVMACCWVEDADSELLREIGARDSKLLAPQQREEVLVRLEQLKRNKKVGFNLVILSPGEIDAAVEGAGDNLNKLELRTSAQLINKALRSQPLITKAIIDCPTKNTAKYADDIKKLLKKKIEVVAEHKADVNYPVVSAASIIAKVARDGEIEKLKKSIGEDIGSGYPADPVTQSFLRTHYKDQEHRSLFRKSWATYKNAANEGNQQKLFGFEDETGSGERVKAGVEREAKEAELQFLKEHGFSFEEPKGAYEVVRMRGPDALVIKYTTGRILVQGRAKKRVEKLLRLVKAPHKNI